MEGEDNVLDVIDEEERFDNVDDDVEMLDVEEGELLDHDSKTDMGQGSSVDINVTNQESQSKNRKHRANKKKNKKKRKGSGSIDINRFVLDTCRRLKEKKSYMVYTAVGCLGVAALSDFIKEVDAIQTCGGQMTADGSRFRNGGGILWNIIKAREPKAYKEIMKKAKDFERQFRRPIAERPFEQKKVDAPQQVTFSFAKGTDDNVSDSTFVASPEQTQNEASAPEGKRNSLHDRLRIPVSYDDDLLAESANDNNAA
ncbi:uncharacterized protein LOC129308441 [Prosopis cineraria]|uniref:uncharacterized protein LOC129308441 n=1 Tax=Prosopis cineraria TaxID=364024 RepID=UPI00240ECC7B|nr:uncharacterized protein LOC129308441 [Prosopis cineraria]